MSWKGCRRKRLWPNLRYLPDTACRDNSKTQNPKLRVFENRVLRRIFGTKRDDVTAGWR
jgi:hypothetical protein